MAVAHPRPGGDAQERDRKLLPRRRVEARVPVLRADTDVARRGGDRRTLLDDRRIRRSDTPVPRTADRRRHYGPGMVAWRVGGLASTPGSRGRRRRGGRAVSLVARRGIRGGDRRLPPSVDAI